MWCSGDRCPYPQQFRRISFQLRCLHCACNSPKRIPGDQLGTPLALHSIIKFILCWSRPWRWVLVQAWGFQLLGKAQIWNSRFIAPESLSLGQRQARDKHTTLNSWPVLVLARLEKWTATQVVDRPAFTWAARVSDGGVGVVERVSKKPWLKKNWFVSLWRYLAWNFAYMFELAICLPGISRTWRLFREAQGALRQIVPSQWGSHQTWCWRKTRFSQWQLKRLYLVLGLGFGVRKLLDGACKD